MKILRWVALALFVAAAAFTAQHFLYEAPVLMYHHVDYPSSEEDSTFVSPESFERQMEFLKVHRYRVIPLIQLIEEIKSGRRIPAKTVSITFDDGNLDNFRNAFPILRKMDLPATIFMISSNIGQPGWLTEEDLRILDDSKITIGSHTAHHSFLPEMAPEVVQKELTESKMSLEKILGHPVLLLSYPAGGVTSEIAHRVQGSGYEGAVTTNYGKERHDPYALHRVKISASSDNLFNFWVKTSGYYLVGKKRVEPKYD